MSFQDNNDSLTPLEKTLKASEALQKKFQLPKSLEMMLNPQKKLEQIYGPSFAMREIFKQREQITKTFQLPRATQKLLDQQNQFKELLPKPFRTSLGLAFPKSIIGSRYSWHSLLATSDNIAALQSISKTIAEQQSIFPTTYFSDYSISALLNIQRQIRLLPADIQTQLVDDAIQATQKLDTSEEIKTEVKNYFDELGEFDTSAPKPEKKRSILVIVTIIILGLLNSQFEMAFYEYVTKPLILNYISPKEVKSFVKDEIKKHELISLYGQRITTSRLNLRTKANKSSELIETLEPGKILHVIKETNLHKSWLKVEVDFNGDKIQGYVLRTYTTVIKP